MSIIVTNAHQIGIDAVTPTNNFSLQTPTTPNGTLGLYRGNANTPLATIFTVDTNNNISFRNNAPGTAGRFQYTSATVCTLVPYLGNLLNINGTNFIIPTAGVTLSATGLTINTVYFVYVWMNGATMTLEASTTGHSTNTATGMEIKTGDPTRTLVGMVYPTTGPNFVSNTTNTYVISWLNKRPLKCFIPLTANIAVINTTLTEIDPSYRINFLVWNGDNINAFCTGGMTSTSISTVQAALFIQGFTSGNLEGGTIATVPVAGYYSTIGVNTTIVSSADSQNYIGLKGASAAGSCTIFGSATIGTRSTIQAIIQG